MVAMCSDKDDPSGAMSSERTYHLEVIVKETAL